MLIDREKGTEMEIENIRRDRDLLKQEVCLLGRTLNSTELEKSKLEEKLHKNQRKCEELEEKVTQLIEEKRVSDDREKRAEERCDKISSENSKISDEKNKLIFELKERINELKNKNLEYELLMGVYQDKYKCSDTMLVKMTQEIETLEELKRENFEANKTIDELRLKKSESDKLAALYKSRLEHLWSRIKKIEEDLANIVTVKMGDLANLVNDVRKLATSEEGGNLDFTDSRGKKDSSGNGITSDDAENVVVLSNGVCSISNSIGSGSSGLSKKGDRNLVKSCTREDDAHTVKDSPGSQSVAHASGTQLMSGAGCFSKIGCSSSAAGDMIEILDSDDETNLSRAADMSNRGVGPIVGENKMTFAQSPSSSHRNKRNRTGCVLNLLANSASKRKRNICTSDGDNVSIQEKENEVLKSTHDRNDCSSSGKCGEEAGPAYDSLTPFEKSNVVKDEVQWAWKREAFQTAKAKINLYSRRSIVPEIEKELRFIGNGVYEEFTNSCFGFLVQLDTKGSSCNAALHYLFAHEVVKPDAGPDELWYRVGGRFIRFSKYEYALVTGLSFGPTTFDPYVKHGPPASSLYLRHYQGRRLKMGALRHDFIDGVFRESPGDALKVAKLLIVYFLLFGMDASHKYIDNWAWALIEDTDRWESFIWGKYTYQFLLRYLQRVPAEVPQSKAHSYLVYGFVWAFSIWAYEAIPELGTLCGIPVSDDVLPRCLRWRFPKSQVDIDGFFDRHMEVKSTLEPSADEQKQPYWEHIHDDLRSGVCYIHWKDQFKKQTTIANPSPLDFPPGFRPHESRPAPTRRSSAPLTRKRQRAGPLGKKYPRHSTRG